MSATPTRWNEEDLTPPPRRRHEDPGEAGGWNEEDLTPPPLKKELINRRSWPSKAELRSEVFDYIEVFYNRERRHSTLGQRSPADYEKMHLPIIEEEQAA